MPTALLPRGGYALSQSPQQYKQILMASGVDKYYQIARCFRNECGRKDRQLEFTQLDLEMAFVTKLTVRSSSCRNTKDIKRVVESLLTSTFRALDDLRPLRFRSMSYTACLQQYGSDKPDLRIPVILIPASEAVCSPSVSRAV